MNYLVSPEMQLSIGGKDYTLSPSVECLKKIQHYFKKDILDVMFEMPQTSFDHQAKIIEIAIEDFGEKSPPLSVIEQWILDEVGITGIRNIMQSWLYVVTAPKREREERQADAGKLIAGQKLEAFLGSNTKNSASAT